MAKKFITSKPTVQELLKEIFQETMIPDGNMDLYKGTKGTRNGNCMGNT